MDVKVAAVTLALSLPYFLWPPKPARAATPDFAPTMFESAPVAPARALAGGPGVSRASRLPTALRST